MRCLIKGQRYILLSVSLASVAWVSSACMLPNDNVMHVQAFYFCFVFLVLPLRLSFPFLSFCAPSSSTSLLVLVSFLFFPASLTHFSSLLPFSSFLSSCLSLSSSIHPFHPSPFPSLLLCFIFLSLFFPFSFWLPLVFPLIFYPPFLFPSTSPLSASESLLFLFLSASSFF